jgi:hypothetical protein
MLHYDERPQVKCSSCQQMKGTVDDTGRCNTCRKEDENEVGNIRGGNTMHPAEILANELNNDEAAKKPGMVYQVWEDGEITLQKSGELLWQRNLHCIVPGLRLPKDKPELTFPHKLNGHSYAFVNSEEDAQKIRAEILVVK